MEGRNADEMEAGAKMVSEKKKTSFRWKRCMMKRGPSYGYQTWPGFPSIFLSTMARWFFGGSNMMLRMTLADETS